MIKPDYSGGSIVNLMSTLGAGLGGESSAYQPTSVLGIDEVKSASKVVLLIIDGLGYDYLRSCAGATTLNGALRGPLTSVFPSTTASAITTYLTGDAPAQHAVTGWHMYMRELGAVITVLPGRARFGGELLADSGIDLPLLLNNRSFAARIGVETEFVMPKAIADSAYTLAHSAGCLVHPFTTLDDMGDAIVKVAARSERRFVHAYWPHLDGVGHRFGMGSRQARDMLVAIEAEVASMVERLRGSNTLLVICADHGQIDTTAASWTVLEQGTMPASALTVPLCGEPRAAYCYPGAGQMNSFADAIEQHHGDAIEIVDAAKWRQEGWYGLGEPNSELASRTGDLLALPMAHNVIKDWLPTEQRYQVVGTHGGCTLREMTVPLIVHASG